MVASPTDHNEFAEPAPDVTTGGPGDYFVPRPADQAADPRPLERGPRYRDRLRRKTPRRWPR